MELSVRLKDGSTVRDNLMSVHRQALKLNPNAPIPPQLIPVECAPEMEYLWNYWVSMDSRRTITEFGPTSISNQEVESWARLRRISLNPMEVKALDAIERLFMRRKK